MKQVSSLVAVAVLVAFANGSQGGEKGPLDKDFVIKVASCNNAEIEVSKLADSRSKTTEIREFAGKLINDHKAAQDKLAELIKNRKFGVVTGLEKEAREDIKRLGKLEGSAFDQAFLEHTVVEHKKAITMFENQVKNGTDSEVRDYAKEMLPDLQKHLKKAQELSKTAGR